MSIIWNLGSDFQILVCKLVLVFNKVETIRTMQCFVFFLNFFKKLPLFWMSLSKICSFWGLRQWFLLLSVLHFLYWNPGVWESLICLNDLNEIVLKLTWLKDVDHEMRKWLFGILFWHSFKTDQFQKVKLPLFSSLGL